MVAAARHRRSPPSVRPCDAGSRRRPRARRRCRARGCAAPAPGVRSGGCPRAPRCRRGRPRSAALPPRRASLSRAKPRSATRRSRPGSSCASRRPPSSLRRPVPGGSSAAERCSRGQTARGRSHGTRGAARRCGPVPRASQASSAPLGSPARGPTGRPGREGPGCQPPPPSATAARLHEAGSRGHLDKRTASGLGFVHPIDLVGEGSISWHESATAPGRSAEV